jgi:small subunit ribosomal protein S9
MAEEKIAQTEDVVVAESTSAPAEAPKAQRSAPPLPAGKHYIWGTGRRKKSVARVRIRPGSGNILINKRDMTDYFAADADRSAVAAPLEAVNMVASWDIWANVGGGGTTGQAGAVELGLARALAKAMPELEHDLRGKGLLTRDSRMKERKKYGQRGARRRFQFSKR